MTRTELKRTVRLIHRHRSLQTKISELEESLSVYLSSRRISTVTISEYKVFENNGQIEIEELPKVDERQLDLLPDYFCLERR